MTMTERNPFLIESDDEILQRFVTYLKVYYNNNDEYPSLQLASEEVPRYKIYELTRRIEANLENQGYPKWIYIRPEQSLSDYEKKPTKPGLDPFFVLAVESLTNTIDKRSFAQKLKEYDMTPTKFKNFLKRPDHRKYWESEANRTVKYAAPSAGIQLAKLVDSGDLNAIKYYNELVGTYRPAQNEAVQNFTLIIARLMEIIARHLDPSMVKEIADEFDNVIEATSRNDNPLLKELGK